MKVSSLTLLWTDGTCSAVNKPAGLPVFAPHEMRDGDCVLNRWRKQRPEADHIAWPDGFAGGIVHRLDNATSGQLLIAHDLASLKALRALFAARVLAKSYRFVSTKDVSWDSHGVDTPLAHDRRRRSRMVVQRGRNTPHRGKWLTAHTRFARVGPLDGGGTLWVAEMNSGVMHQIRVHAASVGIALAGDRHYGGGPAMTCARPPNVPFLLHHVGLVGPDLRPGIASLPGWWPSEVG